MAKPFSRNLYNADNPAIYDAIAWLESIDWLAFVNPNQYAIDLIAISPGGIQWDIEVEVKHNWQGWDFPYDAVHFSARKAKFAYDRSLFIMYNHDRTTALAVRGSVVAKCPKVTKKTLYTEREEFIEVPLSKCARIPVMRGKTNG